MFNFSVVPNQKESMEWYSSLTIHQKITLKELTHDIAGIEFSGLIKLFTLKEIVALNYRNLKEQQILYQGENQ